MKHTQIELVVLRQMRHAGSAWLQAFVLV
jgi:hypothetical protein